MFPTTPPASTPTEPPLVLLVDDDAELTDVLSTIFLHHGFRVQAAHSASEARKALFSNLPDTAVIDLRLPDGSGEHVIEALRRRKGGDAVPVIVISAVADRETIAHIRASGADEYLIKPFQPLELVTIVRNSVARRRAAENLATREAHLQTVRLLAKAIEARDAYTGGHVERVRRYALKLAQALGWPPSQLSALEFGALLHDVGKITIPEHILNKPGPLTDEEARIMREHPRRGAQMLADLPYLRPLVPYVLYHHEHWDGTGYPEGLKGAEIPIEGRLLAVVDAYDAMTTARSYHPTPMSREEALEEIRREAGKAFDPYIAEVFIRLAEQGEI